MPLAVLTCHFNPGGFLTPRRNLFRFLRQMEAQGVPVFTAELAYGEAPFALPEDHPRVLRLRCAPEETLWHKENLLNLLERKVPARYDALAWLDHDVWFQRQEWREATERILEKHAVAQMFDYAVWAAEDGSVDQSHPAAMADPRGHPGFAWAARRGLWKDADGLYEGAVLGGADRIMFTAWSGAHASGEREIPEQIVRLGDWCAANGGAGLVSGGLFHEWHGELKYRDYSRRLATLRGLEPWMITRRADGLLIPHPETPAVVRARIAAYFRSRSEDGAGRSDSALSDARFLPRLQASSLTGLSVREDDYRWLSAYARDIGARRVVEFGPGDGTNAFLDAGCEVISYESDQSAVEGLQERWSGERRVTVLHCAADAVPGRPAFAPDLVFVDGPPGNAAPMSRLPACEWAAARCGRILLHDALSEDESAILDLFRARGWKVELIPTRKGLGLMENPKVLSAARDPHSNG